MLIFLLSLICGINYENQYYTWRPEIAVTQNGDSVVILKDNTGIVSLSDYRKMKLKTTALDIIRQDSTIINALSNEIAERMILKTQVEQLKKETYWMKNDIGKLQSDNNMIIIFGTISTVAIIILTINAFGK